jgi:septum formation protein
MEQFLSKLSDLKIRVVLASASPRRVELLRKIIPCFDILPCNVDELDDPVLSLDQLVQKNAFRKANYARETLRLDRLLIIAADTIVRSPEGDLLGKPKNFEQALAYLTTLSGKKHYVLSGVALLLKQDNHTILELFTESSEVYFHQLARSSIESYIHEYRPYDKAGAYGIQELPQGFLKSVKGSLDNVIGLPTESIRFKLSTLNL